MIDGAAINPSCSGFTVIKISFKFDKKIITMQWLHSNYRKLEEEKQKNLRWWKKKGS